MLRPRRKNSSYCRTSSWHFRNDQVPVKCREEGSAFLRITPQSFEEDERFMSTMFGPGSRIYGANVVEPFTSPFGNTPVPTMNLDLVEAPPFSLSQQNTFGAESGNPFGDSKRLRAERFFLASWPKSFLTLSAVSLLSWIFGDLSIAPSINMINGLAASARIYMLSH